LSGFFAANNSSTTKNQENNLTHTPHELAEEFPEFTDAMQKLRQSNAHFDKLSDEYHELNRAVHRAETDVEPTDDLHMAEMRKQRLAVKDEIHQILLQGSAG